MLITLPTPIGTLLGGLAADHLFEPAFLQPNFLSPLVGFGKGAGMSAMFLLTGFFGALTGLVGVLLPAVRRLDEVSELKTFVGINALILGALIPCQAEALWLVGREQENPCQIHGIHSGEICNNKDHYLPAEYRCAIQIHSTTEEEGTMRKNVMLRLSAARYLPVDGLYGLSDDDCRCIPCGGDPGGDPSR